MKYLFSLLLMVLSVSFSFSQTLTVIDKTSQQPIPGAYVEVLNKNNLKATDADGKLDMTSLPNTDTVVVKHIGYVTEYVSYDNLRDKNFVIELEVNSITLDEIVVSANRWEQPKNEIPYRVERIETNEIQFQNIQTSADLLGINSYAYIQKSQFAGGSPMLRGFATNRVLLVVDGVRMNNAIFRAGNVQNVISIDAMSVSGSEILFGPGAVMYGSDAIGGVMDFHTLQPKLSTQDENKKGNTFIRFSSASMEKTGHFDFNAGFSKWAFLSSVTFAEYNDLTMGTNGDSYYLRPYYQTTIMGIDTVIKNNDSKKQVSSGYSQMNLMQKVLFKPDNHWDIEYGLHYSKTSDAPRYDRLYLDSNKDGEPDFAEWYYGPQRWIMSRLGINNTNISLAYDQFRMVAALQNFEEIRHDRRFKREKLRNQAETVNAISANIDFEKSINDNVQLFYGTEVIYNIIGSVANRINTRTGETEKTATRYPDGSTWQTIGVYSMAKYKVSSSFLLNMGLRYSNFAISANFDTSLFHFPFAHTYTSDGALNGSCGLVYNPSKAWRTYVNVATGYRAPNIDDIGKVFESVPGSLLVPNNDLKPEYAYNFEVGTSNIIKNSFKVDFSLYYTLLDNAIARRKFSYNGSDSIYYDGQKSSIQAMQNISKAYVYGIQAGFECKIRYGLSASGTLCYQYGREKSKDSAIYYRKPHVAPLFGSAHLIYEKKKLKLDFYTIFNGKVNNDELPFAEGNDYSSYAKDGNGLPYVPAWYTLNIKMAWYINTHIIFQAGIENITDVLYRPFASGISAPGRNIIVSLHYGF